MIKLTEEDIRCIVRETISRLLSETVFMDKSKINNKKKEIGLTYSNSKRNAGNFNAFDTVVTDKMENSSGDDTYEVPLKGGFKSYNITSINGCAVMHYFKRLFDRKDTSVNVYNPEENKKEEYKLTMLERDKNLGNYIPVDPVG